ncbi:unnamed protein product [Ambrosiozyma monospora]|uniref:Unnamed protein product n=1 Tax=Ambrosiozyma monospora TaxID=43982 RepID=A0ACB5SZC3_AMBMO|nr:unnamed protein product [Ambrosiozyma monospora]
MPLKPPPYPKTLRPYEISIAKENQARLNEVYADLKKRQAKEKENETDQEGAGAFGQRLLLTNGTGMSGSTASLGFQPTGAGFGNGGF